MVLSNCNSNNHGMNLFVFTVMTCLVLILINVSQIQDTVDKFYKQFRKFLRNETFTDSASCTQVGSSCYACSSDKYTFNPSTMLCYDSVTKNSFSPINTIRNTDTPVTVTALPTNLTSSSYSNTSQLNTNASNLNSNTSLVIPNFQYTYSYTCANDKYTFDPTTKLCKDPSTNNSYEAIVDVVPYSSSLLPPIPVIAPTTLSNYQCYNEDTLADKTCYSCQRGGTYNASLNVCEMITKSYLPIKTYVPSAGTTTCNYGYTYDYGTCVQCNPYDNYVSGHGCTTIKASPATGSYPAIANQFKDSFSKNTNLDFYY